MKWLAFLSMAAFLLLPHSVASGVAGTVKPNSYRTIIALAFSLGDVDPKPPTPGPVPAPGRCDNCNGTGVLGDGTIKIKCPVCDGTGKVKTAPEVAAPADFRNQVPASGGAGVTTVRVGKLLVPDLTAAVAGGALPLLRESVERIDGASGGWSSGGSAGASYGRGYGAAGGYSGRGPIRRLFARAPLRRLGARVFGGMRAGRVTVRMSFRSGRGG